MFPKRRVTVRRGCMCFFTLPRCQKGYDRKGQQEKELVAQPSEVETELGASLNGGTYVEIVIYEIDRVDRRNACRILFGDIGSFYIHAAYPHAVIEFEIERTIQGIDFAPQELEAHFYPLLFLIDGFRVIAVVNWHFKPLRIEVQVFVEEDRRNIVLPMRIFGTSLVELHTETNGVSALVEILGIAPVLGQVAQEWIGPYDAGVDFNAPSWADVSFDTDVEFVRGCIRQIDGHGVLFLAYLQVLGVHGGQRQKRNAKKKDEARKAHGEQSSKFLKKNPKRKGPVYETGPFFNDRNQQSISDYPAANVVLAVGDEIDHVDTGSGRLHGYLMEVSAHVLVQDLFDHATGDIQQLNADALRTVELELDGTCPLRRVRVQAESGGYLVDFIGIVRGSGDFNIIDIGVVAAVAHILEFEAYVGARREAGQVERLLTPLSG